MSDYIFLGVFFVLVFFIPAIVVWATYNDTASLDLRDLWTHQQRIDKFAVILIGTWGVHTSSMIMWTLLRTVQTQDYVTYMGWALPIMAKMFAPQGNPPEMPKE